MKQIFKRVFSSLIVIILLISVMQVPVSAFNSFSQVTPSRPLPNLIVEDVNSGANFRLKSGNAGKYTIILFGDYSDSMTASLLPQIQAAVEDSAAGKLRAVMLDINGGTASQLRSLKTSSGASSVTFSCDTDGSRGYIDALIAALNIGGGSYYSPCVALADSSGNIRYITYEYVGYAQTDEIERLLFNLGGKTLYPSYTDYKAIVEKNNIELFASQRSDAPALASCLMPDDGIDSDNAAIITLAAQLTAGKSNNYEKIGALYDWVATNIYYDFDYYNDRSLRTYSLASEILTHRRAVCEGYANLLVALLRASGIPAKPINGFIINLGEFWNEDNATGSELDNYNHRWCTAWCNGEWILLDPTWDCGNKYEHGTNITGEASRLYFDKTPEYYSSDHRIIDIDTLCTFYSAEHNTVYRQNHDGSIVVTGVIDKTATALVIPSKIHSYPVTEIKDDAFTSYKELTELYISDGISKIGDAAFLDCTSLKHVRIPDSCSSIGNYAFDYAIASQTLIGYNIRQMKSVVICCSPNSEAKQYAVNKGIAVCTEKINREATGGVALSLYNVPNAFFSFTAQPEPNSDLFNRAANGQPYAAYSVEFTGENTPLSELVLPLPGGIDTNSANCFFVDSSGNITQIPCASADGKVVVITDTVSGTFVVTLPSGSFVRGDVDGNGRITTDDARTVLRAAVGLIQYDAQFTTYADINSDGVVTTDDARTILRIAVGLE